ncbi:alpha/beta hydrolase family protein [Ceratobasidium sp. AG-Ba]|nr:alpha/beta hydrolase family protein [Ceratobasidium sp. AG-Ba]
MAAMHPLGYESHTAHLPTGHYYRYVDIHPPQGTKTIATALVLHGFPDSAYVWRHQVKGWSRRGIRLIIPDALGYYGSSQPSDPEEYSFKKQSDHYEALIKHIGLPEGEKLVLIGHDWGSVTAMRLSHVCMPFSFANPPTGYIPTEQIVKALPNFGYQQFFDSPESGPLIDANVERLMATLYTTVQQRDAGERPDLEFETIISEVKAGAGFSTMLNYYRTRKINYELEKDLPKEYRPEMPKLLIVPTRDEALPPQMSANAETEFKNIEVARPEEPCGHWAQLEMPEKVEQVVGDWIERMTKQGTAHLPTGHYYRYVDIHPPQGVKTIVTALLMHGFPDSAYGWRHQIKGWSGRGIRLIIPDALGDDYETLIKDIGLREGEKIIAIGHDWGAITAIRLSQYKPDLIKGVVSVGIPFALAKPSPVYIPIEQLVEIFPSFGYQLFFASPDSASTLDSKIEKFINLLFISAKQFESGNFPNLVHKGAIESWLKDETKEIKSGVGFSAMLNYYRNGKINFEFEKDLPQNYRPEMLKLLVLPLGDIALPPQFVENAEHDCAKLEVARFEGLCGHWVQLEMGGKLERVVGEWVERSEANGWV